MEDSIFGGGGGGGWAGVLNKLLIFRERSDKTPVITPDGGLKSYIINLVVRIIWNVRRHVYMLF